MIRVRDLDSEIKDGTVLILGMQSRSEGKHDCMKWVGASWCLRARTEPPNLHDSR